MKDLLLSIFVITVILIAVIRCAPPTVGEIVKNGFTCNVEIVMPEEPPERGDTVKVKASFTNCQEGAL